MSTDQYAETVDDIEQTLGLVPPPLDSIPEGDTVAEWPTFKKYVVGETEIPPKYRELMGLAVAANIKCPYCTHFHTAAARIHGASDAELAETFTLASFTSRYSAMLHASQQDLDEFKQAIAQVGEHVHGMAADD